MAALIRLLVSGVAATSAHVHHRLRRRPLERRDRRRLPDPHPAGRRRLRAASAGTRWPAWRPCFAGVGAIFGVNPSSAPIDAHDHRDHQRGDRRGRRDAADHRRQLLVQHRLVDRARGRHRRRHRADHRAAARASAIRHGRRRRSIEDEPTTSTIRLPRTRGLRYALVAFLGVRRPRARAARSRPARRCATPTTGEIFGNAPFMDSLLFIISMLVPASRASATASGRRTFKSSIDVIEAVVEDVRRPGRPGLHAADDQPVHRLLQLQQHAERARDRASRTGWRRRASAPCRC